MTRKKVVIVGCGYLPTSGRVIPGGGPHPPIPEPEAIGHSSIRSPPADRPFQTDSDEGMRLARLGVDSLAGTPAPKTGRALDTAVVAPSRSSRTWTRVAGDPGPAETLRSRASEAGWHYGAALWPMFNLN